MRQWTTQQRQAIFDRGGSLLLAAAAGSGKTAVLTQRAVEMIADEAHPLPADRLLIVTFTNAAAAELRQRMAAALEEKLAAAPASAYLRRQRLLLGRANICTVDSLCIDLITRHFNDTDLPGDFTILKAAQETALRQDALEQTLEEAYADEDFCRFASLYGKARSDGAAADALLRLYDITRSMADPEGWWSGLEQMYAAPCGPQDTPWGRQLLGDAAVRLGGALQRLQCALALCAGCEDLAPCEELLRTEQAAAQRLLAAVQAADWDTCCRLAQGLSFARFPRVGRAADVQRKGRVQALREAAKKLLADLSESCFPTTAAGFAGEQAACAPLMRALTAAVRRFAQLLFERKLAAGAFGFDDLEHAALKLLQTPQGTRTPLAAALAEHYAMVMVDEYQDTNDLQERLYRMLAKEDGSNLFLVGDVKQSIYGFREARPENFIRKQDAWHPYDGQHYPALLRLSSNFRSSAALIHAVNDIFTPLFGRAVGGVDYAAGEQLIPGAAAAPAAGAPAVQLLLTDASGEEAAPDDVEAVAQLVCRLLREGAPVRDAAGGLRPCRPGDICILLRSPGARGRRYTDRLEALGIGAWCRAEDELLADVQVGLLLSFLRVLDNPGQDIHLAALLLSPLFGFSPDDLAALRLACPKGTLYAALLAAERAAAAQDAAAEQPAAAQAVAPVPPALAARIAAFLQQLRRLRRRSLGLPLQDVCAMLLDETGLYHMAGALPGGESCQQNLRAFQSVCAEYAGVGGIAGFLRLVDAAVAEGRPLAQRRGAGAASDRVQLMSIHASKGLEFGIVILAGLDHRFNLTDAAGNFLCHGELGAAFRLQREGERTLVNTLALRALASRRQQDAANEEMRLLYVALTRAKDALYLSWRSARLADALDRRALVLYACGGRPDAAALLATGIDGMSNWLQLALLAHPDAAALREAAGWGDLPLRADTHGHFGVTLCAPAPAADRPAAPLRSAAPDAALAAALRENFRRQPPPAPPLPLRVSVSALSRPQELPVLEGPAFLHREGMTGAQRGTALHRFLQLCDLAAARRDPAAELARMEAGGYLDGASLAAIERPALDAFLQSDLLAHMLAAERLLREYEFITRIPAAALPQHPAGGGSVFVLGKADCVLLNGDTAELVDYKTDHGKTAQQLLETYSAQLALYRAAVEVRLKVKVRRCVLYSFALGRAIEVP